MAEFTEPLLIANLGSLKEGTAMESIGLGKLPRAVVGDVMHSRSPAKSPSHKPKACKRALNPKPQAV